MKKNLVKMIVGILAILMFMSSCDAFGKTYTIKVVNATSIIVTSIQYRESGATDWENAKLADNILNTLNVDEEGFFEIPGPGDYEFQAWSGFLRAGLNKIATGTIEFDNMGLESTATFRISATESTYGLNVPGAALTDPE